MFKPDVYVKCVTDLDLNKLKSRGVKLLCFDLDNTLDIPDRFTDKILPEIEEFLEKCEKDFEVFIISNNKIDGRVESFAKIRGYEYLDWAKKPFQKQYKKNEIINSFKKGEVCFIGDKIVTDVIGGNKFGCATVLVDPLTEKNIHWYTKIMSISEKTFTSVVGFKRGKYYDKL